MGDAVTEQPFLRASDFAPCQGSEFKLTLAAGESLSLELIEVRTLAEEPVEYPGAPGRIPFSLLFRGPSSPVLAQRLYALENTTMGKLPIFLVPMRPEPDAAIYESVFC